MAEMSSSGHRSVSREREGGRAGEEVGGEGRAAGGGGGRGHRASGRIFGGVDGGKGERLEGRRGARAKTSSHEQSHLEIFSWKRLATPSVSAPSAQRACGRRGLCGC